MPLISVIVPVYKVEPYLHRCVDSILCQTYQNLEIILIDDGSPDRCGAICDEYAAKDSRILVIHQENGGLGAARNAGLDICTGEYIAFVDSDDYLEDSMFLRLLYEIGDADLCGCGTIREEQCGAVISVTNVDRALSFPGVDILRQHYSGRNGALGITDVCVWGKLYRRGVFEQLRFQTDLLFEDIHLMPFLLGKCEKTRYIPFAGYHYMVTPGSITNSKDAVHQKKSYEDCFWIWEDHEKFYRCNGWDDLLSDVRCARIDKLISHMLHNSIPQGCEVWSRKILQQNVLQIMRASIEKKRKLRYVVFCLLGKRGYQFLRRGLLFNVL